MTLDDIRQRWEKATPGPWVWGYDYNDCLHCLTAGLNTKDEGHVLAADFFAEEKSYIGHNNDRDLEAIANAPNDIAYLLKRLELAEAVIDTYWEPVVPRQVEAVAAWREVAQ